MKTKGIQTNFLYNATNVFLRIAFPILVFPYVSRVLLPEGIGRVNYAQAVVSYFVLFSSLGIPLYGLRAIAKSKMEERGRVFSEIFSLNTLFALIAYIVLFISIYSGFITNEVPLIVLNSSLIFFTLLEAEWYFQGTENYQFITLRNSIVKLVSLGAIFIFVQEVTDYWTYAIILVLGLGGNAFFNLFKIVKDFGWGLLKSFRLSLLKISLHKHFQSILTSSALALAGSIYLNLDTVMIGYFSSQEEVGYYTAAMRIVRVIVSIVLALNTVLLPRASLYAETNDKEGTRLLLSMNLRFIVGLSVPAIIIFFFYSEPIMLLFAGESFSSSIQLLELLCILIFFVSMSNMMGLQILYANKEEKRFLVAIVCGAILNLILNLIWIPQQQAYGAALASVIAEGLIFLILLIYTFRYFDKTQLVKLVNYLVAGSMMCLAALFLSMGVYFSEVIALLLNFILTGLTYAVVLWILKDQLIVQSFKKGD